MMNKQPMRSRALKRKNRLGFRPEILGLEVRTMMASGAAAAPAQVARSTAQAATSIFLGEATTLLAGQPLPVRFVARLSQAIQQGSLTREGALRQILRTPQAQAAVVQRLSEDLLNREPTPGESRALIAGMRTHGADVPWAVVQIMSTSEYFGDNGGDNASFVQGAARDLLHRPASSDELANVVPNLDRGGAQARSRFLRSVISGPEFRQTRAQDTLQHFLRTPGTPEQRSAAVQAFQGRLGYTKMVARVLGSTAASSAIIPTFVQNSGLSVKRVPGFLAGWTVPNLAAPYDIANIPDRKIDDATVDYWAITLSALDSVLLTILPTDGKPAADFAVRIWGPDNKEIGKAVPGADFTYVAAAAGTYILGISTKANAVYPFKPTGAEPAAAGPTLRTYTAEFQAYPGVNTNAVAVLLNYKNPAYTDANWPAWTAAQSQAYLTFTTIASASSQVLGDLKNFTDFRQVGNQTDPAEFARWLTATWAPFQNMLDDPNNPLVIANTYNAFPVIQRAYPSAEIFATQTANAFLHDPATQAAYSSVNELLEGANVARSDIYNQFLLQLEAWSASNQGFLGQDATNIATLMRSGLTDVTMPKPVDQQSWIERLLASIVALAAGVAGAVGTPAAALGVSAAGNLIVSCIDAWLDGDFGNPKPPPPPPSRPNIVGAAIDMDNTAADSYKNTFDLLTNQGFLTSIFSNYGLLEALGTMQFTYAAGDHITPAEVIKQSYDASIWEQLLPRMFSWKLVAPTDNGPADTLPNFTFFIPSYEQAQWQTSDIAQPLADGTTASWAYYPVNSRFPFNLPGGQSQAIADALAEVQALQSGTANIPFKGYDFTPSTGQFNVDWFGPGPVSTAQPITGHAGRFYTVSTNSQMAVTLYRHAIFGYYGYFVDFANWYSWANLGGVTIHQWALETPDGKGGYLELSPDAATALFGAVPAGGLVPTSPNPIAYKGGGSYFDFKVPATGLASRFDVFTQWGKDFPGFAPSSLQPADTLNGGNMHVGLNPKNYYTYTFDNSYATNYKISYGASRIPKAGRNSSVPSGPGPVPRTVRLAHRG
jgi:hypothetical protein